MNAGAVELGTALSQRFNLDLASTVVFDHPTIQALAVHVKRMLLHTLHSGSSTDMTSGGVQHNNYFMDDDGHHLHLPVTHVVGASSIFPRDTQGKLTRSCPRLCNYIRAFLSHFTIVLKLRACCRSSCLLRGLTIGNKRADRGAHASMERGAPVPSIT